MSWKDVITFFKTLTLNRLLPAIVILAVGIVLVRLLLKLFDRGLHRSKLDRTMFGLLRTVMRVLLYTIVILIALSSLGVDVTSLVALLSVLSLAIWPTSSEASLCWRPIRSASAIISRSVRTAARSRRSA